MWNNRTRRVHNTYVDKTFGFDPTPNVQQVARHLRINKGGVLDAVVKSFAGATGFQEEAGDERWQPL